MRLLLPRSFAVRAARADPFFPDDLAFGLVELQQQEGPVILAVRFGRHEDRVVVEDRRARPPFGERRLPSDVFLLRPVRRQVRLLADAVSRRAPPLRPVTGAERNARTGQQKPEQNSRAKHVPGGDSKLIDSSHQGAGLRAGAAFCSRSAMRFVFGFSDPTTAARAVSTSGLSADRQADSNSATSVGISNNP